MKKLLCFLLISLFLVPLSSFAELSIDFNNHPAEYVGCWTIYIPHSVTLHGDNVFVYVLNTDGTMSIFWSLNDSDNSTVNIHSTTGKWTEINNYIVFQSDGKDTYGMLDIHDDCLWFDFYGASFGLQKVPNPDITRLVYPDMSAVGDN